MLDTLGQDRQFTPEQKRFVLQSVQKFIEAWEKQEAKYLAADRDNKITQTSSEQKAEDHADMQEQTEGIERHIENFMHEQPNPDILE